MKKFSGPLAFLSNFHPCDVTVAFGDGTSLTFPSVENAYQACKCANPEDREPFTHLSPGDAKRTGKTVAIRADWDEHRMTVMQYCLAQKFRDPAMAQRLVDVDPADLTEVNDWGDTFWGISGGVGEDHLGRMLRKIQTDLRDMGYQPHAPVVTQAAPALPMYPWQNQVIHEREVRAFLHGRTVISVTGHRPKDIPAYHAGTLQAFLKANVEAHLQQATPYTFIVGGAAGVDQDMHHALNGLKAAGWDIQVLTTVPFDGQWQRWPTWAQEKYHRLVATSDAVVILAGNPGEDTALARQLLMERNSFMVDHSSRLMAFWSGKERGGTFQCRQYARQVNMEITDLYADWRRVARPPLLTEVPLRRYSVKLAGQDVPHTMADRRRSVMLTVRVGGQGAHVHLESEDLCRTVTVPEQDTFMTTLFHAIAEGLRSLKADTPVTIDVPAIRRQLNTLPGHARAGFVETSGVNTGKDIPFRKEWEALHTALQGRPVLLA